MKNVGLEFQWDNRKAEDNLRKHSIGSVWIQNVLHELNNLIHRLYYYGNVLVILLLLLQYVHL